MPLARKLFALPPVRRSLLPRALAAVALVRLALSMLPFARVSAILDRASRVRPIDARRGTPAPRISDVEWAVARTARLVPGATCLTQAFAARLLLARAGVPCKITIGVARDADTPLRAHAWIEFGKLAIASSEPYTDFVPLRTPAAAGSLSPNISNVPEGAYHEQLG